MQKEWKEKGGFISTPHLQFPFPSSASRRCSLKIFFLSLSRRKIQRVNCVKLMNSWRHHNADTDIRERWGINAPPDLYEKIITLNYSFVTFTKLLIILMLRRPSIHHIFICVYLTNCLAAYLYVSASQPTHTGTRILACIRLVSVDKCLDNRGLVRQSWVSFTLIWFILVSGIGGFGRIFSLLHVEKSRVRKILTLYL